MPALCVMSLLCKQNRLNLFSFVFLIRTGGIFDTNVPDSLKAFKIAVHRQNAHSRYFKFVPHIKEIDGMDPFEAELAGKLSGNQFSDLMFNRFLLFGSQHVN